MKVISFLSGSEDRGLVVPQA